MIFTYFHFLHPGVFYYPHNDIFFNYNGPPLRCYTYGSWKTIVLLKIDRVQWLVWGKSDGAPGF